MAWQPPAVGARATWTRTITAESIQLASGFMLTGVTILAIGLLDPSSAGAWRLAFWILALGPAVGILAMWRLRHRPDAGKMAGGHR